MWGRPPAWEGAYVEFFDSRQRAFMRTAYTIVGDWQAAEDATQNAFSQLYVYWPRINGDTVDAYAKRTLVNACLSLLRRRKRETVTPGVRSSARSRRCPALTTWSASRTSCAPRRTLRPSPSGRWT